MNTPTTTDAAIVDDFRGDTEHLVGCIKALISLSDAGAMKPHGLGGHARALLSAAAIRLSTETPATAHGGDDGRKDFESWMGKHLIYSTSKWSDNQQYTSYFTREYWECWKEARATMSPPAGGFVDALKNFWRNTFISGRTTQYQIAGKDFEEAINEAEYDANEAEREFIDAMKRRDMISPTAQPSAKDGVRGGKWHGPTLDAVLRGLRSEDDSTQLRAIISSVETMREEATTAAGLVDASEVKAWADRYNIVGDDLVTAYKAAIGREVAG